MNGFTKEVSFSEEICCEKQKAEHKKMSRDRVFRISKKYFEKILKPLK
jgi:hypothetical protein|tara:strand:+ start:971 stop:1114 length:144 start_codon:yes stop_codon:yes gene_type:complete